MRLLSLTDVRSSLTAYLHSHSVRSCAGELPLSRQTNASGASAAYESMEGLPVSTKTVGGGKAGGISSDVTLSSTRQPALAEPGSVSLDLERGLQGQDAQGHDAGLAAAPSGLNRFMDALLGPVAEDMLYRAAPEVVSLKQFGVLPFVHQVLEVPKIPPDVQCVRCSGCGCLQSTLHQHAA
eukprot:502905-Pelagomonas_calceolata.AAC.5